ncbi:glycosyltransferase family protein [Flavobacteriaceae bacterium]|nr:glycosyltransferase family protein [Flavobacteriaceae bacterium]
MENVIIITQARIGSTRLPSKVLKEIEGKSLLQIHLERLKKSTYGDNIIVATTFEDGVEKIIKIAKSVEVDYYQGNTHDVLDRFYNAAKGKNPDFIVRVTSDCPLLDPVLMDEIIELAVDQNLDYTTNTLVEAFPDGQDVEVIKWSAFEKSWNETSLKSDREHVTPYIRVNSSFFGKNLFKSKNFDSSENYNKVRMTVDESKDFDTIKILTTTLGNDKNWKDYTDFILNNPDLFFNQQIIRNEGSIISNQ